MELSPSGLCIHCIYVHYAFSALIWTLMSSIACGQPTIHSQLWRHGLDLSQAGQAANSNGNVISVLGNGPVRNSPSEPLASNTELQKSLDAVLLELQRRGSDADTIRREVGDLQRRHDDSRRLLVQLIESVNILVKELLKNPSSPLSPASSSSAGSSSPAVFAQCDCSQCGVSNDVSVDSDVRNNSFAYAELSAESGGSVAGSRVRAEPGGRAVPGGGRRRGGYGHKRPSSFLNHHNLDGYVSQGTGHADPTGRDSPRLSYQHRSSKAPSLSGQLRGMPAFGLHGANAGDYQDARAVRNSSFFTFDVLPEVDSGFQDVAVRDTNLAIVGDVGDDEDLSSPQGAPETTTPDPILVLYNGTIPKDCDDLRRMGYTRNGSYIIRPVTAARSFRVVCEFHQADPHQPGGQATSWTLIQRRLDGSVDFYRTWGEYRQGFGDLRGEFWLGNEAIYHLTNQDYYRLRIDMWEWPRVLSSSVSLTSPSSSSAAKFVGEPVARYYFAESSSFFIDNETQRYELHVPSDYFAYTGFGGSGLRLHAGPFLTKDVPPSALPPGMRDNCAQKFHCGWWFTTCVRNANFNGRYYKGGFKDERKRKRARDDVYWPNIDQSLYRVVMKVSRVNESYALARQLRPPSAGPGGAGEGLGPVRSRRFSPDG